MIGAIAARELRGLFLSPLAWAILAAIQLVLGYVFLVQVEVFLQWQGRLAAIEGAPGLTEIVAAPLFRTAAVVLLLAPFYDRDASEVSPVERAIMLMAAFELTAHPQTPCPVIINEAIEIAKTFGGTDGHKFVNGVLDKLAPSLRAAEVKANKR